jgi:hypothetical protein
MKVHKPRKNWREPDIFDRKVKKRMESGVEINLNKFLVSNFRKENWEVFQKVCFYELSEINYLLKPLITNKKFLL